VIDACRNAGAASGFRSLYPLDLSYQEKIETIARRTYGADGVDFHDGVIEQLSEFSRKGYGHLPVCVAKTQYSLSHDPKRHGRPTGFRLPIREVRLAAGAGFILVLTEGISLMPGLPRTPAAYKVDVNAEGVITGLGE
jgi:formyltetrahydrofolate synthetase